MLMSGVARVFEWARTPPASANGFVLDLKQRFEVKEKRGSRRQSQLYRGVDRESGASVALKTVRSAADVREVMLLSKMRHRSIVHCDAVATGSGSVVCAVLAPYVEADLEFAVSAKRIEINSTPFIIRQLLDALAYLHR